MVISPHCVRCNTQLVAEELLLGQEKPRRSDSNSHLYRNFDYSWESR